MLESLLSGPETFTKESIRDILNEDLYTSDGTGLPKEISCLDPSVPEVVRLPSGKLRYGERRSPSQRRDILVQLCNDFLQSVRDSKSHYSHLDHAFSKTLTCNFLAHGKAPHDEIVEGAFRFLSRLPAYPPEIEFGKQQVVAESFSKEYFFGNMQTNLAKANEPSSAWQSLQVVKAVNKNIIRMALQITANSLREMRNQYSEELFGFVDLTAELFQIGCEMASQENDIKHKHLWFVVCSFLWTSWQRSVMLFFWTVLDFDIRLGFSYNDVQSLFSGRVPINLTEDVHLRHEQTNLKASAMCNWAYELLKSDRASLTKDFRRFHERYAKVFGDRGPRCIQGDSPNHFGLCDGKTAKNCKRFQGSESKDQSQHDSTCRGNCRPLRWNETSYRQIQGIRAVCLTVSGDDKLQYCAVSENTLAISHVWAHGQGGRPDDSGLNSCLHERYVRVSKEFGCDSYWMDTPCIPSDKVLRHEAIMKINEVFATSKVTLVVDRDLMDINVDGQIPVEVRESLLATLLVCDWNIRAWTLLEGMRGRESLHLLCQNNKITSVKDNLEVVMTEGSIDVATLFLAAQHLIPHRHQVLQKMNERDPLPESELQKCNQCFLQHRECDMTKPACSQCISLGKLCHYRGTAPQTYVRKLLEANYLLDAGGFISIEEAASLMHHRHATKERDELFVWSQLCSNDAFDEPEELIRSIGHSMINTSFLVSSAPRIEGKRGWSWAPRSPSPLINDDTLGVYYPYDNYKGARGHITEEGLRAEWLIYIVKRPHKGMGKVRKLGFRLTNNSARSPICEEIAKPHFNQFKWVALLRPADGTNIGNIPLSYRGIATGPLCVVVVSNDKVSWEWKGVREIAATEKLPDFAKEEILLI
ncbi:MAG: hypothetical protein M1834_003353 [Cirrosporium novae-zelandiae]|nr:MAG: hypothetical protein M1834_003353 [Cirrosporium novae-zelandiae]